MAKARKGAAQSQNLQVRHQRKSKGNKKKLISIQTRKLKQGKKIHILSSIEFPEYL